MEEDYILVSKSRLISLLQTEEEMSRLQNGGVDNWEWYSESLSGEFDDMPSLTEAEDEIYNRISNMECGDKFDG